MNDPTDDLWDALTAFEDESFASRASNLRHLVHYTSFAALKGIVENREIWFSSASAMNDIDEITRGKTLLQEMTADGQTSARIDTANKEWKSLALGAS